MRLGVESGVITTDQLSSSSYFSWSVTKYGRLHLESGSSRSSKPYSCWGPKHEQGLDEWLQVDLGNLHTITGVITQGDGDPWRFYWVTEFKLQWLVKEGDELEVHRTYKDLNGNDMVGHQLLEPVFILEWSGVEWSGVEWSGVEWSGVEWSGVERSGAARRGAHREPATYMT